MKRSQILICAFLFIFVSACKTQEDIRRERTVETLNEEVQQSKKMVASGNNRFQSIEEQVARLQGQVEEANHSRAQTVKDNQQLNERINVLEKANKEQVEYLKALTEKVNNQSGYIEEVLEKLKALAEKPAEKTSSKKKAVNPDSVEIAIEDEDLPATFDNGMKKYRAKEYEAAKSIFKEVSENKKASKKNREGSILYLGMSEFKLKNYEGAKVYFSKVFSDNPDSSYAPAALLNLGKTFSQLKSKEEANMTYDELLSRFPKSKEAQEAQKLKK